MSSKALCKIIVEQNIQLSKEQIKKIEDFAVKAQMRKRIQKAEKTERDVLAK